MVNTARQDLNRVAYSGLDFDSHNDDLLARLQVQFAADFNDFALSSMGIVLLDLVAFGLDTLSFYLDRRATDNFLQTARTTGSVSRLTRQLGYKMGAAVASSVDLTVAVQVPVSFSVPVAAGMQFQGPNGLIFEAAKAVTFNPLSDINTKLLIPAYEGETLTESFVSDGTANQIFKLARVPDGKFIVQGSVRVVVDGSNFQESDFITFDQTNQFEFAANDTPPTVRFGDGTAGNIPKQGASIVVTYIASSGRAGLVSANTITSTVQPLVVNFQQIQLSITNLSPSVGGDDPESIQSAKIFAPLVFKSRQVAITRADYEALAGSFADPLFGRVAVAQAISSRSAATDLTLQNLIADIEDSVDSFGPALAEAVSAGLKSLLLTDISTTTGTLSIGTQLDKVAGKITDLNNQATSEMSTLRLTRQNTTDIQSNYTEVSNRSANTTADVSTALASANNAQTAVLALPSTDPGPNLLTTATKTSLLAQLSAIITAMGDAQSQLARISTQATAAQGSAGTIASNIVTMINQVTQIQNDVIAIGTDAALNNGTSTVTVSAHDVGGLVTVTGLASGSFSVTSVGNFLTMAGFVNNANNGKFEITSFLSTSSVVVANSIGVAEGPTPGVYWVEHQTDTLLHDIKGFNNEVKAFTRTGRSQFNAVTSSNTLIVSDVSDALNGIEAHVSAFLAADCKANLVTVPILTKDPAGFFAAPSISLIQSLQTFLDSRKEVTQTVSVTSGQRFLIPAVIDVRVAVKQNFSQSVVKNAVAAVVDTTLRDRKFGQSLYLSELDNAIEAVEGIAFYNVHILGYFSSDGTVVFTDKLDPDGNLVLSIGEIITKAVARDTLGTPGIIVNVEPEPLAL